MEGGGGGGGGGGCGWSRTLLKINSTSDIFFEIPQFSVLLFLEQHGTVTSNARNTLPKILHYLLSKHLK